MRASIIITTRNRATLLATRSLSSAVNQNYLNFEIIVVDDGSEDNTRNVAEQFAWLYSDRIPISYIEYPCRNLSKLRNKGVKEALGEYVVFIDDDDELVPDFLRITTGILISEPDMDAIGGGRKTIYPEGEVYDPPRDFTSFYASIDDGYLIRKRIFEKIQYDEELPTDEDADFGLQFIRNGFEMYSIPAVLLLKYGHSVKSSGSFSHPSEWRLEGLEKFVDKNEIFFIEKYKETGKTRDIEYFYRYAGRTFCWGGWMKEGRELLLYAIALKPSVRNVLYYLVSLGGRRIFSWYYWLETYLIRKLRIHYLSKCTP